MSQHSKLLQKILLGRSDGNIEFNSLCSLLKYLGFAERIKGSHHIFSKAELPEIINLQPLGSKAKAYQVKQVRRLLMQYKLGAIDDDQV